MHEDTYKKPDGTYTDDVGEYADAWDEFARPICDATGMKMYGLDPGISLVAGEATVALPGWFVWRFNNRIKDSSKVLLVLDESVGRSDAAAVEAARRDIKKHIDAPLHNIFQFGSIIYLNEWRCALAEGHLRNTKLQVSVKKDEMMSFASSGAADFWASELEILDRQLCRLIDAGSHS